MPHDPEADYSCDLYISGERVDPSLISSLTGIQGVGFKKGDDALSGGKPIIRSYGTWRMIESKASREEAPQESIDRLFAEIYSNRANFSKVVTECGALFRIRARVDMVGREEIFSIQISSDRMAALADIVSHVEIIAI